MVALDEQESASRAAKIIVVIGTQRSGTTVFRELLATNGADDVGEIFHADFKNSPRNFFWYLANEARQDVAALHPTGFSRSFEEFLQENILRDRAAKALIDIKYNALRFIDGDIIEKAPVAIKLLADQGATFLQIIRRNKLRVVISLLIAQKTGQWRSATTADRGDQRRRVRVSPLRALDTVESDTRLEEHVARWLADLPHKVISYEEMFKEDGAFSTAAITTARELLHLSPNQEVFTGVKLKRQNPESISDLVENFDDLERCFAGTAHSWMVSE